MDNFGENHPDTLISMNNLALTYLDQGRLIDAARLQEKVLPKTKAILGENHLDMLKSISSLACVHTQQGKTSVATKLED